MILFLCCSALIIASGGLLWTMHRRPVKIDPTDNFSKTRELQTLKSRHETASVLSGLIEKDGAGAWPPKAKHDSWPIALRPYNDIYLELLPLLSTAEPSIDDVMNSERRDKYRSLMRKLLIERINVTEVQSILLSTEAGNWDAFPREAYNRFYACITIYRHAYRWATIPVVKIAQLEEIVDLPIELDVPWPYLQRNFGLNSESGNNTANVLHSYNEKGERVYKINVGRSELIHSSEEAFFRMFHELEVLAFPIYYEMVRAIICFEENKTASCAHHIESITTRLRHLLRVFYDNMTQARVSQSVWMSYVQGFQAWGAGRMVNGEFIKYDGLSGNQVLFFQALDAFLGINRYLTDENYVRYIPVKQRELCIAFKKHSFRNKLKKPRDLKIQTKFQEIIRHLKVFRATHQARVMPYLEEPAPERLLMTAGKSVLEGPDSSPKEALKMLNQLLATRLKETA